jgi:hypothetical protein
MALEKKDDQVVIRLKGKLSRHEFDRSMHEIVRLTDNEEHVSVRIDMQEFGGWDSSSSWEDLRDNGPRIPNVAKIAFVGDKGWKNWMRGFCRPFVGARVRFFETAERECAGDWLTT